MYSLNAICKATGKRWRAGGKFKSDAAEFLTHLTIPLNNTAAPSGSVETFPSDHGVEILSNHIRRWLKLHGVFHLTAPRREPCYNSVIERSSAVMENIYGFCNAPSCMQIYKLVGLCIQLGGICAG